MQQLIRSTPSTVAERRAHESVLPASETRMILVAGTNIQMMEAAAWSLFRAGHVPVLGEWFAWPLVAADAGSAPAERAYDEIFQPVATRLLARCDAILSVDGPVPGVEALLGMARARGLRVFFNVDDALAG